MIIIYALIFALSVSAIGTSTFEMKLLITAGSSIRFGYSVLLNTNWSVRLYDEKEKSTSLLFPLDCREKLSTAQSSC